MFDENWNLDSLAHIWGVMLGHPCCWRCGFVRRADGKNKPCRGPTPITTRAN